MHEIGKSAPFFRGVINAYTRAIEVTPTADLFLARGIAHRLFAGEVNHSNDLTRELANRAFKDFSDAITLTNSAELEKNARLERLRVFDSVFVDYEAWLQDVEWLKAHTEGCEKGEVLYLDYKAGEGRVGITSVTPQEVVTAMEQAIQLGYNTSGVHDLRARGQFFLCNYNLALQDIETAIEGTRKTDELFNHLCFRANVQAKMGQFKKAYDSLRKANELPKDEQFSDCWEYIPLKAEEVLWRYGMAYELGQVSPSNISKAVIQALVLSIISEEMTQVEMQDDEGLSARSIIAGRDRIEKQFVEIIDTIKRAVGEEFWHECESIARHGSLYWTITQEN